MPTDLYAFCFKALLLPYWNICIFVEHVLIHDELLKYSYIKINKIYIKVNDT